MICYGSCHVLALGTFIDTQPMSNPASSSFTSQRLRLHYVDWGNPSAPPLLLLHGGMDHCRSWDSIARELCDKWHVIAPDLRGHGDSEHSQAGHYGMDAYVYDLAQLIHQQELAPLNIVAHSLGGNIALRYSGLYPQNVRRLVSIEGLGPSPTHQAEHAAIPRNVRMRNWIDAQRAISGRQPRRYHSVEDALSRMLQENPHLTRERAHHLTIHGTRQNEDGTFSWKFDNYARLNPPTDLAKNEIEELWANIECPTLLVYGEESWASNPAKDGRAKHFSNARVSLYSNAGHWVHHDRQKAFVEEVEKFLKDD